MVISSWSSTHFFSGSRMIATWGVAEINETPADDTMVRGMVPYSDYTKVKC